MSKRKNPDSDFETEHVSGKYWLMRNWGKWYPMEGTSQGNLAFLNGPGDNHDGTRASALRIIREHKKPKKNPPLNKWIPAKAVRFLKGGITQIMK